MHTEFSHAMVNEDTLLLMIVSMLRKLEHLLRTQNVSEKKSETIFCVLTCMYNYF